MLEPHNKTPDTNSKQYLKHTYGEVNQICSGTFPLVITRSPGVLKFSFHFLSAGDQDGRSTSDLKQYLLEFILKKKEEKKGNERGKVTLRSVLHLCLGSRTVDEGFKHYLIAPSSGINTKQHPLWTRREVVNSLHLGLNLFVK